MSLIIENTTASKIDLFIDEGKSVKIFAFPGDPRVPIPADSDVFLVRVPHIEPSEELGIVSSQKAREKIPVVEIIGRGFDAYIIESLAIGEGGTVNGVALKVGSPVDDDGILFNAE